MSIWKRLFGAKPAVAEPGEAKVTARAEHAGFTIEARPYRAEGGQYQTAGTVSKGEGEARREHRFVRADRFPTVEDATEFSLRKGRQLVDEQGEKMFR